MSNWKDWQKYQDDTKVCKKDGKFYLKSNPKVLYDSYEEAEEASNFWRDRIAF